MKKTKTFAFDFDGVITDSEILHLRCFNQVLAQFGVEITKKDYYKDYLGLTDLDLLNLLVDKGLLRLDAEAVTSMADEAKTSKSFAELLAKQAKEGEK